MVNSWREDLYLSNCRCVQFFLRNSRIVLLKWMEEGCKENMLTQQGKLETKETAGPTKFNPAIKEARIVEAVETSWNDVWVGRVLLIGGSAPSATWQHIRLRRKTLQPKRSTFEHQPGSIPERECRCSQRSKGKRLGVGSLRKLYCKERKIQCWPSVLGELAQCEGGGAAEAVVAQRGCGHKSQHGPVAEDEPVPSTQHPQCPQDEFTILSTTAFFLYLSGVCSNLQLLLWVKWYVNQTKWSCQPPQQSSDLAVKHLNTLIVQKQTDNLDREVKKMMRRRPKMTNTRSFYKVTSVWWRVSDLN